MAGWSTDPRGVVETVGGLLASITVSGRWHTRSNDGGSSGGAHASLERR